VVLEDVFKHPFVAREKGSGTRQVIEDELKSRGVDASRLGIVMEMGSTGAVKSAVEAGLGITMLSPSSVKHEVALGLLKIVNISDITFKREFYAIHLKSALLPIPVVTFLSYLRRHDQGTDVQRDSQDELAKLKEKEDA
jgi:DNA-binding transcriptional LysR family regulator